MEVCIWGSLLTMICMDMGSIIGLMEEATRGIGTPIKCMEMECLHGTMGSNTTEGM